jgi:hypothetical protein
MKASHILITLSLSFTLLAAGCDTLSVLSTDDSLQGQNNQDEFVLDTSSLSVTAITPASEENDAAIDTAVSITFSAEMNAETLTTNEDTTACTGSLQLSADNFSSCVALSDTIEYDSSKKIFTVTPAADLAYDTAYTVRATTEATDIDGNTLETAYTSSFNTTAVYNILECFEELGGTNYLAITAAGKVNPAYTFNGHDSRIHIPDNDAFDLSTEGTLKYGYT